VILDTAHAVRMTAGGRAVTPKPELADKSWSGTSNKSLRDSAFVRYSRSAALG
jgi:hypothetical protein